MSQHDFEIANQGFPSFRSDLNSGLQALASNSAGATEPSTTYAYQMWYDSTANLLKMRNTDNDAWITLAYFDQTNDEWEVRSAVIQAVDAAGVVIKTDDGTTRITVADNGNVTIANNLTVTGTTTLTGDVDIADKIVHTGDTNTAIRFPAADTVTVETGGSERVRVDSSGNVGIGTSSPNRPLTVYAGDGYIQMLNASTGTSVTDGSFIGVEGGTTALRIVQQESDVMSFHTSGLANERMRIDSSGNLLVGKTSSSESSVGVELKPSSAIITRNNDAPLKLRRNTSDGDILQFAKDGSTVGSIQTESGVSINVNSQQDGSLSRAGTIKFRWGDVAFYPNVDNAYDLGLNVRRFDDIYATNGTIQTSDSNDKQDIEELSEAEQRVAQACKGLLRKFRWKDAVSEKGDNARIHFGIIAQDLQAAFEAEGLDAGRYGMFISSTWWEHEVEVPAVEAVDAVYETVTIPAVTEEQLVSEAVYDDEGNEIEAAVYETVIIEEERTEERLVSEAVEAKEAYTRTDTYETAEEAPEGAVERTRLGVRYPELLAFIISAI